MDSELHSAVSVYEQQVHQDYYEHEGKLIKRGIVGIPSLPVVPQPNNNNNAPKSIRSCFLNNGMVDYDALPTQQERKAMGNINLNNFTGKGNLMHVPLPRQQQREEMGKISKIWIFLVLRFRKEYWQFLVREEMQCNPNTNLFEDNKLDIWTNRMIIRVNRDATFQSWTAAVESRLGLFSPVYCHDGFYGDQLVGSVDNKTRMPCNSLLRTSTPRAMNLKNGQNIFVSQVTPRVIQIVEAERMRRMRTPSNDSDEDKQNEADMHYDDDD